MSMTYTQHIYVDSRTITKFARTSCYVYGYIEGNYWSYSTNDGRLVATFTLPPSDDPNEHFDTDSSWRAPVGYDGSTYTWAMSNGYYWNWGVEDRWRGKTVDVLIGPEELEAEKDISVFFDIPVRNGSDVVTHTVRLQFIVHIFHELDYTVERDVDGLDVWSDDLDSTASKILVNRESIMSSLDDIIFTSYLERPGRPDYGSPVPKAIWSTITASMAEDLLDRTVEAVSRWEPRVLVDKKRAGLDIGRSSSTATITIPLTIRQSAKKVLYRRRFSYGS